MQLSISKNAIAKWLVCLLVFIVFFVSVDILPPGVQFTLKLSAYLISIVLFLFSLRKISHYRLTSYTELFLLGYVIFYFLSAIFSLDRMHGLWIFFNSALLLLMLFFVFKMHFDAIDLTSILKSAYFSIFLIVSLSLLSLFGLIELGYYFNGEKIIDLPLGLQFFPGYSGVYLNRNSFGMLLATGVILSLFFFMKSERKIQYFVNIFVFFLFLGLLLLTLSRASIVMGLGSAFIAVIFLTKKKRGFYFLTAVILCSFFAVLFFDFTIVIERFSSLDLTNRDVIWRDAMRVGIENIFFGLGPNEYIFSKHGERLSAHSFYLHTLACSGFPAITFWLLFILGILSKSFYTLIFHQSKVKYFYTDLVFSTAIVSGIVVNQVFETSAANPLSFMGLTILICLSFMLKKTSISKPLIRALPHVTP